MRGFGAGLAGVAMVLAGVTATANTDYQFFRSIGGPGQFYAPCDVTVDSSGDIWVADTYHQVIQEFNSSGNILAT